jgi:UDPglucose 6-dehydrogenase
MPDPVIFDGRNVYDPDYVSQYGIRYYGIGRGDSVEQAVSAPQLQSSG